MAGAVQGLPTAMTSLPMPTSCLPPQLLVVQAESPREEGQRFLLQAFHSFSEAAASLERSYGSLQIEVSGLRQELEQSHAGLARSLEENRRMRLHLDRILDGIPCGVLVLDENKEISLANPEARRLLAEIAGGGGFGPKPAVPQGLHGLLHRAQLGGEEAYQQFEDAAGEERWLAARHAPLRSGDSEAASSIFILRDVSESRRLARERELLRREQALAEMSAVLAHEIRNPLGSMELFAGLLAASLSAGDERRWIEQLQAGLRTLAATVNNVLHFHSLPDPARIPVDLGLLLDWAQSFLQPLVRHAEVELKVCHRLGGVTVLGDRHRLEQVLLNLVINALRATPADGRIEISGEALVEESAVVSVSDTGPGIAAADLPKIFEAGFSTRQSSPGLGLAVCRKIAEQHGGSLEVRNRPSGGAMFTVRLPRAGNAVSPHLIQTQPDPELPAAVADGPGAARR